MIDENTMQKILELGRFHLNESEKERFRKEIGDILSYVEMLEAVDTTGAGEPVLEGQKSEGLRPDVVLPGLSAKTVGSMTDAFDNGLFVVPRILEELHEKKDNLDAGP